ncbi:MAG: hypothetical protein AAF673_05095, partial [Pseudomonadota bacterium]
EKTIARQLEIISKESPELKAVLEKHFENQLDKSINKLLGKIYSKLPENIQRAVTAGLRGLGLLPVLTSAGRK